MLRQLVPITLILAALAIFFFFTKGEFDKVTEKRAKADELAAIVSNYETLNEKSEKIVEAYNNIKTADISRLESFLPDNVDNVKLILAVENIAKPYAIQIKNVKFDTTGNKSPNIANAPAQFAGTNQEALAREPKAYGSFDMEFTMVGKYPEFVKFLADLEKSLRIVDVADIAFASADGKKEGITPGGTEFYTYEVKMRTYWLRGK